MLYKPAFQATALAMFLAGTASAHAFEAKFRGMYICAKLPTTRDVLRVPIDVSVHDNMVQFARPLFNLNGTRVVGTELAAGTMDGDGTLHLSSEWSFLGDLAKASYTGKLTPEGGTLIGSQDWTGPGGANPLKRPCAAAFVATPESSLTPSSNEHGIDPTENEP